MEGRAFLEEEGGRERSSGGGGLCGVFTFGASGVSPPFQPFMSASRALSTSLAEGVCSTSWEGGSSTAVAVSLGLSIDRLRLFVSFFAFEVSAAAGGAAQEGLRDRGDGEKGLVSETKKL